MNELTDWFIERSIQSQSDLIYARPAGSKDSFYTSAEKGVITVTTNQQLYLAATPLLILNHGDLERLMTAMWQAGIRPESGEGSPGQLGATERHLADMRKVAFKKLGIDE
jgi:hypothetical protein